MNKYEESAKRRWDELDAEGRRTEFVEFYAAFLRLHDPENPSYVGDRDLPRPSLRTGTPSLASISASVPLPWQPVLTP